MKPLLWFVTLTLFCAALPALADPDPLTREEASRLAVERSATLKRAGLGVEAASLSQQAQGFAALPTLEVAGSGSLDTSSGAPLDDRLGATVGVTVSGTLYDGGQNRALTAKAELATRSARETYRSARLSLLGNVDAAFYAVLQNQASVEAARGDLAAAQLRLRIAQAKVNAHILSQSDYLQTQSEAASYELTLNTDKKNLASARAKLASLTGRPAVSLNPVDFARYDSLRLRLMGLEEDPWNRMAVAVKQVVKANNPGTQTVALAHDQAGLAVDAANAEFVPTLSAGYAVSTPLSPAGYSPAVSGSVTLTASWNLDWWVVKNAVDSAKIALRQAEFDIDQSAVDLELSVDQALLEWVASARAIDSAAQALAYAAANYDNVLEKFKLSSVTASDLSQAEALVSTVKTTLINAQYTFLADLTALRTYAGLETDDQFVGILF